MKEQVTDPSVGQKCIQINETTFKYWDDNTDPEVIDITTYTPEEQAEFVAPFGHTLEDVDRIYGNSANQIIAECIFEMQYANAI